MRSLTILKIFKYIFTTLLFSILFAFLIIISSNRVINEIFEYLKSEVPINYEKISGNIYSGIKIKGLNYDDMIEVENANLDLALLPLILKEIYIKDLKLEKITFKDKFFKFLEEQKEQKEEEKESSNFDIPLTLYIKNLELSLYDFTYEDEKIDEIVLKAKKIKTDFKNKHSLELFSNIKSTLANIELNGKLEDENYKIESKIDLKKYIESSFLVDIKGNFKLLDLVLKNDTLKIEDEKELKISDTILKATLDIEKQNLDISSLKSNINYQEISSKLEAKASLEEFDIEKFSFEANLNSSIKKSILNELEKNLEIKSKLKGDLKEIKFENSLASNSLSFDDIKLKIENSILNGVVKLNNKNLDINSDLVLDLNFDTNYIKTKTKIDLKLNLDDLNNPIFKSRTVANNLDLDLDLKSSDLKRFDFDLNLKKLNINEFTNSQIKELDKIKNLSGNVKGFYDENLNFSSNFILNDSSNDSFKIDANFKSNKNNFEANIKNSAFFADVKKEDKNIFINSQIKELGNFEKEINKIYDYEPLNLSGNLDLKAKILEDKMEFEAKSPKISLENESFEKIEIKAELKGEIINFSKLEFFIGKIYDINLQKKFIAQNKTFLNTKNLNGNFDFENIVLKTSKDEKNTILNLVTKDLNLEHTSYAKMILDSNIKLKIDENSKIFISGDANAKELKAFYNIQALNISKDKDIIIVSKHKNKVEKDFFLQNIAMDLIISANELKYSVKNIDLKANAILNIKKDFEKNIRIYGSINDTKGTFEELGRVYNIEDSNIYFRGLESINPLLDIKANTKIDDISIYIKIGGNLNNPRLNLSSDPSMNQKDILSYLIFGTNFANTSEHSQSVQSQASLFLLNELSRDYAKELGVDMIYFQYDPTNQYIETHIGKNIGEKSKVILKNKAHAGQLVLMRELTKLWNIELGFEEKTQSVDIIYRKRY